MESTPHDQSSDQAHDHPHDEGWHDVQPETDDTVNPAGAAPDGSADETTGAGAADGPDGTPPSGGRPAGQEFAATAQAWLGQLQTIIDNITTQSAPVIREVGAKAAELAAVAADRAGPFAQRAADATQNVSVRVAERSRELAAELRRGPEGAPGGGTGMAGAADSTEFRMAEDEGHHDDHNGAEPPSDQPGPSEG
jgi:hypothetical protein